ncbi:MAG: IS1595 family transposase, partial [Planctomycetota bacterium]|nr:IS1595 family transposase [Planctomycetota bacterium]
LGTHQGAVQPSHLDYYLDEFTFRFNRRTSRSRGPLFYRLMQQGMATKPLKGCDLKGPGLVPRNP